ncbi:EpsG family protein [Acinetobacter gerneri]|uniref:EpsG family protein n=1 Tax=Acinetobacter gerneri TaxID=202952 RepID=UPI002935981A|nr:EpsG family protein [Acinetobacter gerneri]MDV2440808.1 EpsG family protein [Acinetobacter gerneri]
MSFFALPFDFRKIIKPLVFILYFLLVIVVGLRYQVGGDWVSYHNKLINYQYINTMQDFIELAEPGYGLLNYLSVSLNITDIIWVNLICAILFFTCFYKFSNYLNNLIFPLFICFTYTILVVATGYTRQSVAIGFSLLVFLSILEKNVFKYFLFIFLGLLFHKTIIVFLIFLPFLFNILNFERSLNFIFYTIFSIVLVTVIVYLSIINEYNAYTAGMTSRGAYMRLIMHVLPIIIYLFNRNFFRSRLSQMNMAVLDLSICIIIYLFVLAIFMSTVADRINLYFVFFDIFVLTFIFNNLKLSKKLVLWFLIFISNTIVLTLWLFFGKWTAEDWLPYNNYLLIYLNSII